MGRPLPKLDRGRSFGTVFPTLEDGTAFKQDDYYFDASGKCVEGRLSDKLRARHFGDGNAEDRTLIGSSILPARIEIAANVTVALGSVVAQAHKESGLSVDEWNALPHSEREELLQEVVERMAGAIDVAPAKKASITVGAKSAPKPAEEEGPPTPRDPEKFEPIVPDPPKLPEEAEPGTVDLAAWIRGTAEYKAAEVIKAIKVKYSHSAPNLRAARDYLIEEVGLKPGR